MSGTGINISDSPKEKGAHSAQWDMFIGLPDIYFAWLKE
jgi:hypothetical protein